MACNYDPDLPEFNEEDQNESYIQDEDESLDSWSLSEAGFPTDTFHAPF